MTAKVIRFLIMALVLTVCSACLAPAPPPQQEPAPAGDAGPTGSRLPAVEVAAPDRFTLNFTGAYLVYDLQTGTLQIAAEGNVLSYGGDWEVRKVHSYLFHLRLRTWQGFFWQVNTSRKEVFQVRGGTFGSVLGGTSSRLSFRVDVVGGAGGAEPQRFTVRFPRSHLLYAPAGDVLQLITENTVLSYCGDWQRCRLRSNVYQFKQNNWDAFFWKVNTVSKKAWRCRNGVFCQPGGTDELLNINVRVTR
jgi:hypothetical protein